jgi:hypothetical protein
MTQSKRYAAHYDELNQRRAQQASPRPVTLPQQAYGPTPLEWTDPRPVWAWVQWPHQPAQRIPCFAVAHNDRVVIVRWWLNQGGQVDTVVWRNAVTHRTTGPQTFG